MTPTQKFKKQAPVDLKVTRAKASISPQKIQENASDSRISSKSFAEGNRFSGFGVEVITGMTMVAQ